MDLSKAPGLLVAGAVLGQLREPTRA